MVPVEQPQLGWGVTIHTALEKASTASPTSCSIEVQPGSEHGLAWGVCKEEEQALIHNLCQGLTGPEAG